MTSVKQAEALFLSLAVLVMQGPAHADQEDAETLYNRGCEYYNFQKYVEAMRWWLLAAKQGNADAQYNLGVMYYNGEGIPQDLVLAHLWLNLAASRITDPELRALAVEFRDSAASKMTAEQIAEAQKLAREWKPK